MGDNVKTSTATVARPVQGALSVMLQMSEEIEAQRKKAEPVPLGTVLRLTLAPQGDAYVFAGVFAGGRWYFTGAGGLFPDRLSHGELVRRLATTQDIVSVEVAASFERFALGNGGE